MDIQHTKGARPSIVRFFLLFSAFFLKSSANDGCSLLVCCAYDRRDHVTLELLKLSPFDPRVIVELYLDETRMEIPPVLRAKRPYYSTLPLGTLAALGSDQGTSLGSDQGLAPFADLAPSADFVTWACPKWRLLALPSNPVALSLSPDRLSLDGMARIKSKWVELRGGKVGEPLAEPFWLKANDSALNERKVGVPPNTCEKFVSCRSPFFGLRQPPFIRDAAHPVWSRGQGCGCGESASVQDVPGLEKGQAQDGQDGPGRV